MKAISSKRARACLISNATKWKVAERDSIDGYPCCIFCHSNRALPEAHYISRANGGLGIPENIMTVCRPCHYKFDNGTREEREEMRKQAKDYFLKHYPDWNEEKLIYGNQIK